MAGMLCRTWEGQGVLELDFFCDASQDATNQHSKAGWRGGFAVVYRVALPDGHIQVIRKRWRVERLFTVSLGELAAVAECLEAAIEIIDVLKPARTLLRVFTDSEQALGYLAGPQPYFDATASTFKKVHVRPLLRAVVWQSHHLAERGCNIEVRWMPRKSTEYARDADFLAGCWRNEECDLLRMGAYARMQPLCRFMPHRSSVMEKVEGQCLALIQRFLN